MLKSVPVIQPVQSNMSKNCSSKCAMPPLGMVKAGENVFQIMFHSNCVRIYMYAGTFVNRVTVFCRGRDFATFLLKYSKCRIQNHLGAPFVAY